jgi:hypothetical protein
MEVPDRIDRFQASYGTSARLNLWLKAHAVCGELQRSVGGTGRPVLDLRGTNTRERSVPHKTAVRIFLGLLCCVTALGQSQPHDDAEFLR